jgi:hypothetical protein
LYSQTCVQRPPLRLKNSGRYSEVDGEKLVFILADQRLGWSLLTGGRYSEVAGETGLTVILIENIPENRLSLKSSKSCRDRESRSRACRDKSRLKF